MGCGNSRQENFGKINLWEPQKLESESKSYHGSRTAKERVLFPETSCNRAVDEDQYMDQKKIEQYWENQKVEHSVCWDLKAEGSLSEAIDLLHFSEISEWESSSSSARLKDLQEDA